MGLFACFRIRKRDRSRAAPAAEASANQELRNVAPLTPPNQDRSIAAPVPETSANQEQRNVAPPTPPNKEQRNVSPPAPPNQDRSIAVPAPETSENQEQRNVAPPAPPNQDRSIAAPASATSANQDQGNVAPPAPPNQKQSTSAPAPETSGNQEQRNVAPPAPPNQEQSIAAPLPETSGNQEQRNVSPPAPSNQEQSIAVPAPETSADQEQRTVAPPAPPNQEQCIAAPAPETSANQEQRNVVPEPSHPPRVEGYPGLRIGGTSRGSDIAGTSRGSDIARTSRVSVIAGTSRGSHIAGTYPGPSNGGHFRSVPGNKLRFFSYYEFRTESLIGRGDFGSVFKGRLQNTDELIAIRELSDLGQLYMTTELETLSRLRHANIISLIGYCVERQIVVYEFMPLESLYCHLHSNRCEIRPLDWNTRMSIAAGVAGALKFLHDQPDAPVIFRNLKSSSVLLDEGFRPKLSDFWLAKTGPEPQHDSSHVSTKIIGNLGYWAPEYKDGNISFKTDVYSFGVLLLEIVTGKKAWEGRHLLLDSIRPIPRGKEVARIADPKLKGLFQESMLDTAVGLALECTNTDPDLRPTMKRVASVMDFLRYMKYEPNARIGNASTSLRLAEIS